MNTTKIREFDIKQLHIDRERAVLETRVAELDIERRKLDIKEMELRRQRSTVELEDLKGL